MESTHHVLMSERFLRERGADENTIAHMLLGAAMPDLIQEKIGGSKRAATHFELDETKGGQLHKMDLAKIMGAMETAELPYDSPLGDGEDPEHLRAHKTGIFLHLIQDYAYDAWIAKYIEQVRCNSDETNKSEEASRTGLSAAIGDKGFAYRRKDTGVPLSSTDVAYVKRWSWGQSYRHELSLHGEDPAALVPDKPCKTIARTWERMTFDPRWDDRYLANMEQFWGYSIAQESLPPVMADLEEQMLSDLIEVACEEWKTRF